MRDLTGSRVALFVPCYVDQLAPHVGFAALEVLRRIGVAAEYPADQTCCGQPFVNLGCADAVRPLAARFAATFAAYDYVVCPSGSCTAMVHHTYAALLDDPVAVASGEHTYELCEFLARVAGVTAMRGRFPHRVGLLRSCHGLRGLRLGSCSERVEPVSDPVARLLSGIDGLELVEPARRDECCGFGGTFSVTEPDVSAMMGRDRIRDFREAGAEIITATDVSCLMHLDGLLRRANAAPRSLHVAEILAACEPST